MKREARSKDKVTLPVYFKEIQKVQKRVSEATGVSERTIRRILKEQEEQSTSFGMPGKKHDVPRRITETEDFDKCVVRCSIHNFYAQEGTVPTVAKLLVKLKESTDFKGNCSSLRRIIRDLGFRWKKTRLNRGVLIERHNIRSMCVSYLTALRKYKASGHPIIFEDETYIHGSHTRPKNWTDDSDSSLLAPTSKGERLVIVHAVGRASFISNALLIYKSRQKTRDYHN
ncbi:hypothetical protein L798_09467 [Zootermopsis nevadensis]|uniref:Uncharacterized protein n=1 Tax=Zootermopsis nevadensis TaxID=136037 RepID=A0A067QGZ1_ZOONE|nr:hypothetical protein L798_09467 [Zootermopsis nevadensis]